MKKEDVLVSKFMYSIYSIRLYMCQPVNMQKYYRLEVETPCSILQKCSINSDELDIDLRDIVISILNKNGLPKIKIQTDFIEVLNKPF